MCSLDEAQCVTGEAGGDQPDYHSYLLRVWREYRQSPWRASLESAATGQRHSFADLERLFAFLAGECPPLQETKGDPDAHEGSSLAAPPPDGESDERDWSVHPTGRRSCR